MLNFIVPSLVRYKSYIKLDRKPEELCIPFYLIKKSIIKLIKLREKGLNVYVLYNNINTVFANTLYANQVLRTYNKNRVSAENKQKNNVNTLFHVTFDECDFQTNSTHFIRVELVQKTKKNNFLQLYNEMNDTVRFWSKKNLLKGFIFSVFQSLFICAYFAILTTNILLQYTANHKLYLHTFNKCISPYVKTIHNLNLKFNVCVVISKPNTMYLNFQKKKFGSIKKSRKKLMYRFLPIQQPKLP